MTCIASRNVNDVSFVDGAVFGEWEGDICCLMEMAFHVTRIKHVSHFSWQARYLVRLEGDICCSAHCQ